MAFKAIRNKVKIYSTNVNSAIWTGAISAIIIIDLVLSPNEDITDNIKMDIMAHVRRGRHLTLVNAGIAVLRVLNLQYPVLGLGLVDGAKPLI